MKANLKLNEEILLNKQQPIFQNYFRTENKIIENKPKLLINKLPSAFSFRSNNNSNNNNNNNNFF